MLYCIPFMKNTRKEASHENYRYFIIERYNTFTYFPRWLCGYVVLGFGHEDVDSEKINCYHGITFDEEILGLGRVVGFDLMDLPKDIIEMAKAEAQCKLIIDQVIMLKKDIKI